MENNITPKLREAAKRLLAYEGSVRVPSGVKVSKAFRVCEKLREPLSKLMGVAGFRAVFSRALTLASGEIPWLREVHIKSDGSLQGVEEVEEKIGSKDIAQGEAALVGQLLALLVTFIGSTLTLGLLRDIWPEIDDLNF